MGRVAVVRFGSVKGWMVSVPGRGSDMDVCRRDVLEGHGEAGEAWVMTRDPDIAELAGS